MSEKLKELPAVHQERQRAVSILVYVYNIAPIAYVQGLQKYGITHADAQRQLENMSHTTRRLKWEFVKIALALNPDFAEELAPYVQAISWLFECD